MQTFLPYKSFLQSARVLDNKRLGKQRVETWQIYNALTGKSKGWRNHPAVKMWRGYETALLLYGIEMCMEWRRRGFMDTMLPRFANQLKRMEFHGHAWVNPPWMGSRKFHRSHKSNLLRKDRKHYRKHFTGVPANLPYVWNTIEG